MKKEKFITTTKLAKIMGISRIAVFKKIRNGEIQAIKMGRKYIIPAKSLSVILGESLCKDKKIAIESAVKKTVKEYGEVLKKLGSE